MCSDFVFVGCWPLVASWQWLQFLRWRWGYCPYRLPTRRASLMLLTSRSFSVSSMVLNIKKAAVILLKNKEEDTAFQPIRNITPSWPPYLVGCFCFVVVISHSGHKSLQTHAYFCQYDVPELGEYLFAFFLEKWQSPVIHLLIVYLVRAYCWHQEPCSSLI